MLIMKPAFFILALILLALIEPSCTQSALIQEMASRQTRYHHFLWHNIRENWNRFSSDTQAEIRDLGWAPPNPARQFSGNEPLAITDNFSGEDFLYMHRQMVNRARSLGAPSSWITIPAPGDSAYPVPPAYTIPGQPSRTATVNEWKTDSFYESDMLPVERRFTDPSQLRGMTLAEMGARIEVSIHSYMHVRFSSSSSYGYRPTTSDAFPDIDESWDDPSYDWLVDNYSSQVNPIFWKLHGWVDDRIEDWRRANGLSSIRWSGTWVGGPMSSISNLLAKTSLRGGGEQMEMKDDIMLKVARIIAKEGVESSPADLVLLDIPVKSKSKPKSKSKTRMCKTRPSRKSRR